MMERSELGMETSIHNVHPGSMKREKEGNNKERERGLKVRKKSR